MSQKLPEITRNITTANKGFHGFSQIVIEDVQLDFHDEENSQTKLPLINGNGNHTTQAVVPTSRGATREAPASRQQTFLTGGEEDDEIIPLTVRRQSKGYDLDDMRLSRGSSWIIPVSEAGPAKSPSRPEQQLNYCLPCGSKAAMETGRLTEKIMELKLEADVNRAHYETVKRKLDNTFRELKTAQAMMVTLKSQNNEKADRIANLTREATIGLWAREKKKLLQFADVREASLEYELSDLKASSVNFKHRALDRIQFLHDQVYKLRLKLNLQSGPGKMNKLLDTAEKNLAQAKDELNEQKEEFFQYRKAMVGMLAGFNQDFRWLANTVNAESNMASNDFFDLSEKFENTLGTLYKGAQVDKLLEKVEGLSDHYIEGASIPGKMNKEKTMSEVEMLEQRKEAERLSNVDGMDGLTEAEALEKLEMIEQALKQSKNDLENFDESFNELSLDINDSGVSLNEFSMNESSNEKTVRFKDEAHGDSDYDSGQNMKRRKRRPLANGKEVDNTKACQTDFPPELGAARSGKGKRYKKARSRSSTPKRKTPKKIEGGQRLKKSQDLQAQWLSRKQGELPDIKSNKSTPENKKRTNNMATFTHLRELYAEKRVCNLIDRTTGVVNLDLAEEQFPNLSQTEVMEGFTQFITYDSNNDFRLDIHEMVRAISRTADEVIDPEEIKAALFELGVLDTDELDFFDFLCIQETLTTGAFDKSKSKMLRLQSMSANKKAPMSKYCALM